MQSLLTFAFVVFVAVSGGAAQGDDDCPAEVLHSDKCCLLEGEVAKFSNEVIRKCVQKHGVEGPSPSEMMNSFACIMECAFAEVGLLTADNKLDKSAVSEFFSPEDPALRPVVSANLDQCLASLRPDQDSGLQCDSGAGRLYQCLARETVLSCPTNLWSASPQCEELRVKVTRCPDTILRMSS